VRLHEYIARGWDASLDQWRLPIYPTLDRNFRPGATSSWKLEVTDERGKVLVDPEYKGPRPAPLKRAGEKALQAPGVNTGPSQLGTATTSQFSFVTEESSAGSGTVPSMISTQTQATSIEVAASSPRDTSISGQVTAVHDATIKAEPCRSKGKGKALEISQA
jgi:NAD(P)H-dependent FMN reductase